MTARDELASAISKALGEVTGIFDTTDSEDLELADAILAAGYRKPRTITTAKELDALPFESVIADAYGTPHVCERHRTDGTRNGWRMSGNNHLINSEDVLYHGPATVLYEQEPQS